MYYRDTIAAISTPIGEGGIGIVRLSGDEAVAIAGKMFASPSGQGLAESPHKTLTYGYVVHPETRTRLDEVLVSVMRAPHTYTKEDVVEINIHSGNVVLREALQTALQAGARLAEPGEFTKRAFLNGRIDLAQAEAVIDLIRSSAPSILKLAEQQLEGFLSREVKEIRSILLEIAAHLEAGIDFSDEDIETLPGDELLGLAKNARVRLEKLLKNAEGGKIYREGVKTAIIGKPNVGKSSLLNLLLRENRAIVTAIPGTTRDIIEEKVLVKGICLNLQDTAGIRHPRNEVEKIGVRLSRASLKSAQLVLLVVDRSQPLGPEDEEIIQAIKKSAQKKVLVVVNKADLPPSLDPRKQERKLSGFEKVSISAKTGQGIEKLEEKIADIIFQGVPPAPEETLVTNIRHIKLLKEAEKNLREAAGLLENRAPDELAMAVLRDCLDCLGGITGETVSEEILEKIFSRFCIGK